MCFVRMPFDDTTPAADRGQVNIGHPLLKFYGAISERRFVVGQQTRGR